MKTTIIITGQLDTSTAFGVCMTTGEKVFIPAAVARPINVTVNREYEAVLMENVAQRREQAPWRAVKLFGEPAVEKDQDDDVTDDEVLDALGDIKRASAYELACQFYEVPRNSETVEVKRVLDRLAAEGKIAKAVVSMGPLIDIRYSFGAEDFA